MNLSKPKRDLDVAKLEIEKMKSAQTFDDLLIAWENFLFRVDRCWDLTQNTLKNHTKDYSNFNKPYAILHKKEPLLKYLKQARNSDTHSIESSILPTSQMEIQDKSGRGIRINSISYTFNKDGTVSTDIHTPDLFPDVDIKIVAKEPKLLRIKNRGKWYNPPRTYLRKRINDFHPASIAQLGYEFYKSYIYDAEKWLERGNLVNKS